MPVPTDITAGTISITGTTVTGVGTSWIASDIRQGDLFIWIEGGDGFWQPIVTVVPGMGPMSALSKTYRIVVFRKPEAVPGKPVFQAKGSVLIAGRGKIDYSEKHLRLALPGETAFNMPTGPVYDINNGQVRYVRSGGFWIESVTVRGATVVRYNGSLTDVPYISVVA